jgi:DNA-binding MarR family transcriptional regulator
MDERPDETRLAAWRALLNAHAAAVGAIERELAAADLIPLTWYDVLVALWEAPGHRLRLNELARAVVLSRSGLSRLLDRLERADLLRREPCPDDRRGAFAVLTPEGAATLRRTWPAYARGIDRHFARFVGEDEAAAVAAALSRVASGACPTADPAPSGSI